MKWVGLTGGIGSGKSTVSRRLRELDFPLVDADEIARQVVQRGSPGLTSILEKFGPEFVDGEGHLDRRKLGAHIFGDKLRQQDLQNLLFPLIREEVRKIKNELAAQGTPLAIYDMPLLFESQAQGQFDKIIVVRCTPEQQKARLRARNQWSDQEIEERLRAQLPLTEKEKGADFILHNDQDLVHLEKEMQRLVLWLKGL